MNATLNDVKWCCDSFRSQARNAGSRGFGIFVDNTAEPIIFVLQHRSMEPGAAKPDYPHGPLALVSDLGILHCPWCGKDLNKWYRKSLTSLSRRDLAIQLR
jgi:hypothetical protein